LAGNSSYNRSNPFFVELLMHDYLTYVAAVSISPRSPSIAVQLMNYV